MSQLHVHLMTQQVYHGLSKSTETEKFIGVNTVQKRVVSSSRSDFCQPKSLQIVV